MSAFSYLLRILTVAAISGAPFCPALAENMAAPGATVPVEQPALRGLMPDVEVREPKAADLDRTKGQQWYRATMDLSGSMCTACLMQIEEKLRELPGVAFAEVKHPAPIEVIPGEKPPIAPRTAPATIVYDGQAIKFARLITWLKREKFKALTVNNAPVEGQ